MKNMETFEKQLAAVTDYYNEIIGLRKRQKDDGIMIRIFLDEIELKYKRLIEDISANTVLPQNVKTKLLELVRWELERAPGRELKIAEYERTYKAVFVEEYQGDLAENHKLEAPFSIMAYAYNQIRSLRERQRDDSTIDELLLTYNSVRVKVETSQILTKGIKDEILALIDEEIRLAPIREDAIIQSERSYSEDYAKAYNAALARYANLSPLLKLKYADQLKRLKDEMQIISIAEINSFFKGEKDVVKSGISELPNPHDDDDSHDTH